MKQQASQPIIMYSAVWCGDCRRAKRFLDTLGVSYVAIDIEHDSEAMALVEQLNNGRRSIPTIHLPRWRRPGRAVERRAGGEAGAIMWSTVPNTYAYERRTIHAC